MLYNVSIKFLLVSIGKLTPELCIITTATADILIIILQIIVIKRLAIEFSIFSKTTIKYLVTSLLFIPSVLLIKHFIPFDGIKFITLRTISSIAMCTLLYVIMLVGTRDDIVLSLFKDKKIEKTNN